MKKIYFMMALCLAAAACTKQNVKTPSGEEGKISEFYTVDVLVPKAQTKMSAPSANEDSVNNLQIFVFDTEGNVDNIAKGEGNSLSVKCTKGERNIYVVANAADLPAINDKTALLSQLSSLSDNSSTNFVMTGNKTVTVDANLSEVSVEVVRLPARICLKSFTNEINLHPYKDQDLVVNSVYMLNVAAQAKYFTPDAASDFSFMNFKSLSDKTALFYEKLEDVVVAHNESLPTQHYFYCYPNATADDCTADDSTPRHTRLVVEATLGTKKCYYVATIPQIKRNTTYDVTMHIQRPGSASPDSPLEKQDSQFSVTVKDWATGQGVDETI